MNVSNNVCIDVLQDILGIFLKGKVGLADINSASELQNMILSLQDKWEKHAPGLYEWYLGDQALVMESSMLKSV